MPTALEVMVNTMDTATEILAYCVVVAVGAVIGLLLLMLGD